MRWRECRHRAHADRRESVARRGSDASRDGRCECALGAHWTGAIPSGSVGLAFADPGCSGSRPAIERCYLTKAADLLVELAKNC